MGASANSSYPALPSRPDMPNLAGAVIMDSHNSIRLGLREVTNFGRPNQSHGAVFLTGNLVDTSNQPGSITSLRLELRGSNNPSERPIVLDVKPSKNGIFYFSLKDQMSAADYEWLLPQDLRTLSGPPKIIETLVTSYPY